jgi:hypothetical protein
MHRRISLALLAGLLSAACGSDSPPTGPSNAAPATIQGTVNGDGSGALPLTASAGGAAAVKAGIKVTVVGSGITTTTDSSGRFTLTGITSDRVTLLFEGSGINATLEISGLVPGQTLTIKVKVKGNQASMDDGDDSGSAPVASKCFSAGQKAEVEGKIAEKGGSDITVFQQGKGDYLCRVSATTRIRHGNKTFAFSDLKVGNRVHVSGRGQGTNAGACVVEAEEIKLQD